MTDIIVIAIVGLIVGLAVGYIYKAKRKGVKCIGCSVSGCCSDQDKCDSSNH